jgi:transcription-repair coupling factor (superfamily II helicase)
MIQRLVPMLELNWSWADGREETGRIDVSFMNGEFDVLVATTIIESGLDVPNANTIFTIMHNFGLSDLHQMRGRVGRSNKAFCYFICPPYSVMTDDEREFRHWNNLVI